MAQRQNDTTSVVPLTVEDCFRALAAEVRSCLRTALGVGARNATNRGPVKERDCNGHENDRGFAVIDAREQPSADHDSENA
jgi:hypothetical protein